jgi:hypothetical protein
VQCFLKHVFFSIAKEGLAPRKEKNIFRAREGTLLPQRNASFLLSKRELYVLGAVLPDEHSFQSWSYVHWLMVIGHLQAELPIKSYRSGEVLLRQKHFIG